MEERDLKITEWIDAILERSKTAIAYLYPSQSTDFFKFDRRSFWQRLKYFPLTFDYNPEDCVERNAVAFMRYATLDEQGRFISNQVQAVLDLDEELLSINSEPLDRMNEIEISRHLFHDNTKSQRANPLILIDYVWEKKEFFDKNASLHFITRLPQIMELVFDSKETLHSKRDFNGALYAVLRDSYGVDFNPGFIPSFIGMICPEINSEISEKLESRQRAFKQAKKPKKITAKPIDPNDIREPSGLSEVMAEATGMRSPGHEARQIGGGRAHGLNKVRYPRRDS